MFYDTSVIKINNTNMLVILSQQQKCLGDWVLIDSAHSYKHCSSAALHSDGTFRGGARGRDSIQRGGAPTRVAIRGTHPCIRAREEKPYRRAVSTMAVAAESSNPISMQADI